MRDLKIRVGAWEEPRSSFRIARSPNTRLVLLCSAVSTRPSGHWPLGLGAVGSRTNRNRPAVRCAPMPRISSSARSRSCSASYQVMPFREPMTAAPRAAGGASRRPTSTWNLAATPCTRVWTIRWRRAGSPDLSVTSETRCNSDTVPRPGNQRCAGSHTASMSRSAISSAASLGQAGPAPCDPGPAGPPVAGRVPAGRAAVAGMPGAVMSCAAWPAPALSDTVTYCPDRGRIMRPDMSNLCVIAAAAPFGLHTGAQHRSLGPPAAPHRRRRAGLGRRAGPGPG